MSLYRPLEAPPGMLRFKLVHLGGADHAVRQPADARAHGRCRCSTSIRTASRRRACRRSGSTTSACRPRCPTPTWKSRRCTRCSRTRSARIFRGEVENDDFNRLVIAARIPARGDRRAARLCEVPAADRLRAVAGVHRDARSRRMRAIARMLVELFKARFDPDAGAGAGARMAEQERAIEAALEKVENLSEDRVLRQYLALILATTRTNFWRRDAAGKPRTLPVVQVRSGQGARTCPSRSRCSRSSSTRRASRACTCAAAASRAAACAGRTGRRISAPRCWAS